MQVRLAVWISSRLGCRRLKTVGVHSFKVSAFDCKCPVVQRVRTRGDLSTRIAACPLTWPKRTPHARRARMKALREGYVVFHKNLVAPCVFSGARRRRAGGSAVSHEQSSQATCTTMTTTTTKRSQEEIPKQTLSIPLLVVVLPRRWRRRRRRRLRLLLLFSFRSRCAGRRPATATGPGRRRRLQIRFW